MANFYCGYEKGYPAKWKKVGAGITKNMLGGEPSTSWCSGAEDKLNELSSASVKIQDSLPARYVSLMQLKILREAQNSKESGSEIAHIPTVSSESHTKKDTRPDENRERLNLDMGIGDGNLEKKEVKQRRIQDGVPCESQDHHSGDSGLVKREVTSRWEAYGEHKFNSGVVDQRQKWTVKKSPETARGISNDVKTYQMLDAPRRGISTSKGNAERPNHDQECFENEKEVECPRTGMHGLFVMGSNEGENDLQNVKHKGEVANELGERGIIISNPSDQNQSVQTQDSTPLGYVPLKQLQLSRECERRKERESKIYISNQDTCTNKFLRDKESASDENDQKGNWDTCIGDEALDKNDVIQTGGSGIEDLAPNKDKQIKSGNLEASKGQTGKSSKKIHSFEVQRKHEHGRRKSIESSQQRYQNILPKEASSSAGTISRVIQGRDCFAFTKEIGGNGNGKNGFHESGADTKEEDDLSHAENQYLESEDLGEEVISISHISSPNSNDKVQGYLPSQYFALTQLQSSKESETRKDCGLKIYIPKQNTPRVYNTLQRNTDYAAIRNTTFDSNKMTQTESLVIEDRPLDKHKENDYMRAFKGHTCKSGQIYDNVMMKRKTHVGGSLHDSVEMFSKELEQYSDKKKVQPLKKGNQNNYRRFLAKGTSDYRKALSWQRVLKMPMNRRKGNKGHWCLGGEIGIWKHADNQNFVYGYLGGWNICVF